MTDPSPRTEFFACKFIDFRDDKIAARPGSAEGYVISAPSTTKYSKTYVGGYHTMDSSPCSQRPLLPKKRTLKASKELQYQLSMADLPNPGMTSDLDPFSEDSDSSFDEVRSYSVSSDRIFDTYFDEATKDSSLRSPLYKVDPYTGSPVLLSYTNQSNLTPPLQRSSAKRTPIRPRRVTQPEYTLFPSPSPTRTPTPTPNPLHHSWPTRTSSSPHIRPRPRANTTPSNSTSTSTSTHSNLFVSPADKSHFDHDDDDEDDRSAWRKALRIRAGSSVEKEMGENPKRSLRMKLKGVFKRKMTP